MDTPPAPIYLIGMPASGKSTLGLALARILGRQFIDLDIYIQGRYARSIPDMFATWGEEHFRRLEHAMLLETSQTTGTVIACGGGTPCHHQGIHIMNSTGTTVWLDTPPPRLLHRLTHTRNPRPALQGLSPQQIQQYITDTLTRRTPVYRLARHTIDGSWLETKDSIHNTALRLIKTLNLS